MTVLEITYDRNQRCYQWIHPTSGEVLTAPSGKQHKAALLQQVTALLDPELYEAAIRWIEDEPALERVIWRGVDLVASEGVETFPAADYLVAKVNSSDGYGRYAITIDNGYLACECPYWQELSAPYASNGHRVCKHLAALTLYQRVRENRF